MITTKNAINDIEFTEQNLADFRKVGFLPFEKEGGFMVRSLDLFYRAAFKNQTFGTVKNIEFKKFVKNRNLFYGVFTLVK